MSDTLQRFLFEDGAIRGELVSLDETWQEILARRDYPPQVKRVLGETLAAAALLVATLKFEGSLTMQVRGDGPISMLVVDASSERTFRGLAHWEGLVPEGSLHDLFGKGQLAITIDPKQGKRYQGIVELAGSSLADAIVAYLERSEQLATRLWLSAGERRVAGLLLQRMPHEGGTGVTEDDESQQAERWEHLTTLGETIRDEELLQLDAATIIRRLFHEETLRLFPAEPLKFHCSCSRERVAGALRGLGREEMASVIAERGEVEVDCEFCNNRYRFDRIDVEQLFATDEPSPEVPTTRH